MQQLLDRWRCYLYNEPNIYRTMIIDVSQQLKEPVGSYRHYRISESDTSPIYGEVDLLRTDRGIFVSGTLNTTHKAVCSRCLSSFEQPLTLRIEEEYLSKAEEGAFTIGEHQEIDLSEAVRQYALLVLPMKPLCSEDCAGLCHRCGHNLNLGPCDCLTSYLDPRFAPPATLTPGSPFSNFMVAEEIRVTLKKYRFSLVKACIGRERGRERIGLFPLSTHVLF